MKKLCKDCKHHAIPYTPSHYGYALVCARQETQFSPVKGEHTFHLLAPCDNERSYGWLFARIENRCGREGRFFESNEVKP